MPATWRPSDALQRRTPDVPWTVGAQRLADKSVRVGLREIQDFFARHPAQVEGLWSDAMEPFLNAAYAAGNMPELRRRALESARGVLDRLVPPYAAMPMARVNCDEIHTYLLLLGYTQPLSTLPPRPGDAAVRSRLLARANHAVRDCGGPQGLLGLDYRAVLANPKMTLDELYDLVMWSVTLIEARAIDGLHLPEDVWALPGEVWKRLRGYPWKDASTYAEGANDYTFYDVAYLATHVSYMPSGYGRYQLFVEDAPWLIRFLRDNFYAVLEMGELDLVAEFVDAFRQLGCTEENDRQVRDGARFILALYEKAGRSWTAYREPGEVGEPTPYDIVHKPWTGMGAMRRRLFEAPAAGTYGGAARRLLGLSGRAVDQTH